MTTDRPVHDTVHNLCGSVDDTTRHAPRPGDDTAPPQASAMTCTFCRDTPSPGFRCDRCGAFTPAEHEPSNKGAHGQAVDQSLVQQALRDLAVLRAGRAAKATAREEQDRAYTDLVTLHTQHPQSRGTRRKMLSRP
jgi:hypothetical protein